MLVKLTAGQLMPLAAEQVDANENMIERDAMLVYTGDFESMDGPVSVTDEHLCNLSSNHNSWLSKFTRLATGDLPAKAYPPIQLDHSPSAKDTVGRLVGDLTIRDYEDDGVIKKALFGKMRILGKENVERVKDGRWTHLSIGADLETGKLNELTITPFPAAPNASMLSKGKTKMGTFANLTDNELKAAYDKTEAAYQASLKAVGEEHPDTKALKAECATLMSDMLERGMMKDQITMSAEGDGKMDKEKLKKHLMEDQKMSAEDADKKLAEMPEDEQKKLASDIEEKEKMAAAPSKEEDKEKIAKMAAARTGLAKLSANLKAANESIRLATVKAKLHSRLSALKADAKITPAEIKKIDLTKLAAGNQATIDAVFESYEKRERLVLTGVYGSAKSMNVAEMARRLQAKKLEEDTLSNMSFTKKALANTRKASGTQLAEPNEVKEKGSHMEPDGDETDMSESIGKHFDEMMKMVSEGKHEDAKSYLKGVFKRYSGKGMESKGDVPYDKNESLADVESEQKKMHTIVSDTLKLIADLGIDAE